MGEIKQRQRTQGEPGTSPRKGLPVEHGVVNPDGNWQDNAEDAPRPGNPAPATRPEDDASADR